MAAKEKKKEDQIRKEVEGNSLFRIYSSSTDLQVSPCRLYCSACTMQINATKKKR
jgi:hypothetical protein